jgi:LysM repeat protein
VPTLPTNWIRYQVQSGDTLSALAVATGTTVQVLIEVNCIRNPSLLILGQVLFLPREPLIQGDAAGDDDDDDGGVGDIDSGGDDDSGDDDGDDDDSGGDDDDGDDDDSGDDD